MSTYAAIYEAVLKKCAPYSLKLGGPIDGAVPDFFKTPAASTELRNELSATFSQEQLQGAGLLRKNTDGKLSWPFPLSDGAGSQVVFALRKGKGQPSFDIVTEKWCLSYKTYPVLAVMDHDGMSASRNQHLLFITATLADAAFFWKIGLPAICGTGLQNLAQPWLDKFCEKFEFGQGKGAASSWNAVAPKLVLVQWSPSNMDWKSPPAIEAIVAHFHELREHLDVQLESICLWRPTPEKRRTFQVCVKYAGAAELRELVLDSVDWCKTHLDDLPRRPFVREPRNYVEANQAWRESLREGNNQIRQEKLWSGRTEKLETDVLDPLRQQAQNCSDPVERGLTLVLAELSGVLDPQMAILSAKVEKLNAQGNMPFQSNFPTHEFETTVKLVDRVLAATKEIQACRSNQKFAPKSLKPTGNDSGSPPKNSPR